jgi:hypothetical protein
MTSLKGIREIEPQGQFGSGANAQETTTEDTQVKNHAISISANNHHQSEISEQERGWDFQQHLAQNHPSAVMEDNDNSINNHETSQIMRPEVHIIGREREDILVAHESNSGTTPQLPVNEAGHQHTAPRPHSTLFNDIAGSQGSDARVASQQTSDTYKHTPFDNSLLQPDFAEHQIPNAPSEVLKGNPYKFAASLAAPALEPAKMVRTEQQPMSATDYPQSQDASMNALEGGSPETNEGKGQAGVDDDISNRLVDNLVVDDGQSLALQGHSHQEVQDQSMEDASSSQSDTEEEDGDGDQNNEDGDGDDNDVEEEFDEEDEGPVRQGRTQAQRSGNNLHALWHQRTLLLDDKIDKTTDWEILQPTLGDQGDFLTTQPPTKEEAAFEGFQDGQQFTQYPVHRYDPRTQDLPSNSSYLHGPQAQQIQAQRQYMQQIQGYHLTSQQAQGNRSTPCVMAGVQLSGPPQPLHSHHPPTGHSQHTAYGNIGFDVYPPGYPRQQYSNLPPYAVMQPHLGHGYQMLDPSFKSPQVQSFMPRAQPMSRPEHMHFQGAARAVQDDEHDCGDDDEPLQTRTRRHEPDQSDSLIASSPPPAAAKGPRQAPQPNSSSDVEFIASNPKSKPTSTKPAMQKAQPTQKVAPLHHPLPQPVPIPTDTRSESSSSVHTIDWKLPKFEASYEPGATKHDPAVAKISIPNLIREDLLLSPDHAAQEYHLLLNIFMPAQQALATPDPAPAQALLNFHTIAVMVIEAFVQYEIGDELGLGRGHWHNSHDQGDEEYARSRNAKEADPNEIFFAVIDRWRAGMESNKKPLMLVRGAQEFCDVALDLIYYIKENGLLRKEKVRKQRADKGVKRGTKQDEEEKEEVKENKEKGKGKGKVNTEAAREQPAKANKGAKRGSAVTTLQSRKKSKVEKPKEKTKARKRVEPQLTVIKRTK